MLLAISSGVVKGCSRRVSGWFVSGLLVVVTGCVAGGPGPGDDGGDPTAGCPALPDGVSGSPMTIPEAVAMANALVSAGATPLTIPCFLSRLDRPLTMSGVDSTFSLQPGDGPRSPRMFVFLGPTKLVLSISPAGVAKDFIELAEYPTPLRSIKAEMSFPLKAPLSPSEPYERIRVGTGTVCGGCHRDEAAAPAVTLARAFESGVFKPTPAEVVPIPSIQEQSRTCDPELEPFRCAMFQALLDHGPVLEGAFPDDAPTIYQ